MLTSMIFSALFLFLTRRLRTPTTTLAAVDIAFYLQVVLLLELLVCPVHIHASELLHGTFESLVNALPLPRIDMYTVVQQIFISLVASFMCPLTPETLPTCHLHDVRYGFYNLLPVPPGTDCEF